MTQEEAEGFYQKNIDWQRKVHKETKLKQCEKINEGVSNLTFTPKIVFKSSFRTLAGKSQTRKMCHCCRKREFRSFCNVSSVPSIASKRCRVEKRILTHKFGTLRNRNSPICTEEMILSIEYFTHALSLFRSIFWCLSPWVRRSFPSLWESRCAPLPHCSNSLQSYCLRS